jgi:hypothetical protein
MVLSIAIATCTLTKGLRLSGKQRRVNGELFANERLSAGWLLPPLLTGS